MEKKKSKKNQKGGGVDEQVEKKIYPTGAEHYELYEEVGHGVSASVHRALCKPLNEIVAIKILDFERENCDLTLDPIDGVVLKLLRFSIIALILKDYS
ncbi:hypothetical protein G4B88_005547 [Cannabis sativa]|uniref:Uncharacterized protein n=1 Tax=Cannabis sativa TaxID=3483 RepID=A0A7J6H876_CANSA|nr:hypothetical protein G4B88_005547 [Cannabis sativa]